MEIVVKAFINNYSINEVADMFGTEKTYIPPRPGEYDVTLCDYSKAQEEINYNTTKDLEEYVKQWLEVSR